MLFHLSQLSRIPPQHRLAQDYCKAEMVVSWRQDEEEMAPRRPNATALCASLTNQLSALPTTRGTGGGGSYLCSALLTIQTMSYQTVASTHTEKA